MPFSLPARALYMIKILKYLPDLILKIMIIVILPLVVFMLMTSRISVFGLRSYVVLTGSMEPLVPVGSMVFVLPENHYQVGDVITFHRDKVEITHRVFAVSQSGTTWTYVTKGDANQTEDLRRVYDGDVIGKVFIGIPEIGKFTGFLKTVPGFLLFIVVPTLIFVGLEGANIKKEWEKEVEKKLMKKLKEIEAEL